MNNRIITSELAMGLLKANVEITGNMVSFLCGTWGASLNPSEGLINPTNRDMVMKTIYRAYQEYPELNIDKRLSESLSLIFNKMPSFFIYCATETIAYQMIAEKEGTASFRIDCVDLLKALRERLIKEEENLKNYKEFVASKYEDGALGYINDLDKEVVEKTGKHIL